MSLLVERCDLTEVELVEDKSTGLTTVRGRFGRVDAPTKNKRVYSRKLMEREISRLGPAMEKRRVLGEVDHPTDGKTKLTRASHVITKLSIDDEGWVLGEAILMGTAAGRDLKEILKVAQIGVSSRGGGTTTPGQDGTESVNEDFALKTYDFVFDPAVEGAYPTVFESAEDEVFTADTLRKEFGGLVEEIEEAVKQKAAAGLEAAVTTAIDQAKTEERSALTERFQDVLATQLIEVREQVKAELLLEHQNDPAVSAAKTVLGKICEMVGAYVPSDVEKALRDDSSRLRVENAVLGDKLYEAAMLAKEAGFQLAIERKLAGHRLAGTIRSLLRPAEYDDVEQLEGVIDKIVAELESEVQKVEHDHTAVLRAELTEARKQTERVVDDLKEAFASQIEMLSTQIADKTDKLKRAVEIGDELERDGAKLQDRVDSLEEEQENLQEKIKGLNAKLEQASVGLHRERRMAGNANRSVLEDLTEGVDNVRQIDTIVDRVGTNRMTDPQMEAARQRGARGRETTQDRLEESGDTVVPLRGAVLGQSLEEIRRLTRVGQ